MDTREVIRRYLVEHSAKPGVSTFDEGRSLLDQGVLDSFDLVNLVTFLEKEFGIEVADDEIDAALLSAFNRLCAFVDGKRGPTT